MWNSGNIRAVLVCVVILHFPLDAHRYHIFWADAVHDGFKNPQQIDRMLDDVASARGNAIFVQIRQRGGSYYLRSLEPPAEDDAYSKGFDALQDLIDKAHARKIEVHAWMPVYPLWPTDKPPSDPQHVWHTHGPRAPGDAMWMGVSSKGEMSPSMEPGHPDALRYLANILLEPVRKYDLDGLHLDMIRYPEDADYGYNPKAVERYRRLLVPSADPAPNQLAWSDFRRRQVTDLMRQVYLRAIALKPKLRVSAALVATGSAPANDAGFLTSDAYAKVFQSWRAWMLEGIVDIGVPQNYFREDSEAPQLDRWMNYQKDRQYGRAVVHGLGSYLNQVDDSMAQLRRAIVPSATGNVGIGVSFFSYAATSRLDPQGNPIEANDLFFQRMRASLGDDEEIPVMPWKDEPRTGHVSGRLQVDGPSWLADGATVLIESDSSLSFFAREATTDGSGFFGSLDYPPGLYHLRILRAGAEVFRTTSLDVKPGRVTHFDMQLTADDFELALPLINDSDRTEAAPGETVTIQGVRLARAEFRPAGLPLPLAQNGIQVLVNGEPAALVAVTRDRITFQLPYSEATNFEILVRHDGVESPAFGLPAVVAAPKIVSASRRADGIVEILATGLGSVSPSIAPGVPIDPANPAPSTRASVRVRFLNATGEASEVDALFSGLAAGDPGRYKVTAKPPEGFTGISVQLLEAGIVSAPATLP